MDYCGDLSLDQGSYIHNYEESDSDEDMAELEAMLYSQIYYEADETSGGKNAISCFREENEVLQCFSDGNRMEESCGLSSLKDQDYELTGYRTPGGDSGCIMSRPSSSTSVNQHREFEYSCKSESGSGLEDSKEDSRYCVTVSKTSTPLVPNPCYQNDTSESDSDDGIIILPRREKTPPEVICIDSNSCCTDIADNSTILISDDDSSHKPMVNISEEKSNNSTKNSKKNIRKSLKKKKSEYYKADYGSDFEDNFCSDSSELELLEDVDESGITLNLLGKYKEAQKRKFSSVLENEVVKTKSASSVEIPSNWTKEMDAFYNDVNEKYLDIEIEDIFAEMPRNSHWPIDRADLYTGGNQRSRYFQGKRCNNCNQFGHLVRECPEPVKIPRCPMCGQPGHAGTRCPERKCLRCGQPGFDFLESCMHCRRLNDTKCNECGYYGHVSKDCPDLWRRFHATNAGEVVVTPEAGNADKPERDCWCCNCGRKGHVLDNCRSYSYSKYPPSSVRVVNYDQPKIGFDDYIPIQSKKARREEKILLRREKKMLKKSKTCPNSPSPISLSKANFNSEPSSPRVRESAFPTSLLVEKAIKKLDKEKSSKKKWREQNKNKKSVLSEIINSSTFKAEVGESDNNNVDKSRKRGKAVNSLIKACNESKKFNRMKEWKEKRGFGKKEASNTSKASANEEITVPRSIKAACKFLKKEMQRKFDGSAVSEFGRKIKKDLKEEIFGLRNMHTEPTLNKKKRKRLANLVLEVRNCP